MTTQLRLIALLLLATSLYNCKSDKKDVKPTQKIEEQKTSIDESKKTEAKPTLLFFGNSLTAGYGLSPEESFPSLVDDSLNTLGYKYNVVNAGLSGETTSGGVNRIDWVLNQDVDVFVLELGANDMLRGLPLEATKENLTKIISTVQEKYPEAKVAICQMMASPNMGKDYAVGFEKAYKDIATSKGISLIPFLWEKVAFRPEMMLQDGKHPNANGQKIIAAEMLKSIMPLLKK